MLLVDLPVPPELAREAVEGHAAADPILKPEPCDGSARVADGVEALSRERRPALNAEDRALLCPSRERRHPARELRHLGDGSKHALDSSEAPMNIAPEGVERDLGLGP